MTTCICAEYDGRGYASCGAKCELHPPEGKCPDCETSTYKDSQCFKCYAAETRRLRPKSVECMQQAYHHLIQAFQALERWDNLLDEEKSRVTSRAVVQERIARLRQIWSDVIGFKAQETKYHGWTRE